jgi:hypothetical protein
LPALAVLDRRVLATAEAPLAVVVGPRARGALAVLELVVGHATVVQVRALLMELRLGPLGLGLARGDPCPLLGLGGLALALLGLGAMLSGHALTPALQLSFVGALPGSRSHARDHEGQ